MRIPTAIFACLWLTHGLMEKAMAQSPREVVIKVNGMFCPFCTFGIEKRLKTLTETDAVRTDLAAGETIVTLKSQAVYVEEHFVDAVKRAGFTHSGIALRESAKLSGTPSAPPVDTAPQGKVANTPHQEDVTFVKAIGLSGNVAGQFN